MSFQKIALPFGVNDLAPAISKDLLEIHYAKHHEAYAKGADEALKKMKDARDKNDFTLVNSLLSLFRFHLGGFLNHNFFWESLTPFKEGREPSAGLGKAIEASFGSFEKFKEIFEQEALKVQGSGWLWLALQKKSLIIVSTTIHGGVEESGLKPILNLDMWEHAYYLQYKNLKADYVKNIWKIFNWQKAQERLDSYG